MRKKWREKQKDKEVTRLKVLGSSVRVMEQMISDDFEIYVKSASKDIKERSLKRLLSWRSWCLNYFLWRRNE